ncbi:MAG: YraN family protein [Opitutales bacterium]
MNFFHRIQARLFPKGPKPLPAESTRAERGRYGEDLAEHYCRSELGYRILARNWRSKKDELDLICLDAEVLVFIEVRSRAAAALVSGYASVNAHKKKVLQRGCKSYLKQLQNPPKHFRFDIIEVRLSDGQPGEVSHYANIPLFHKHYTPPKL